LVFTVSFSAMNTSGGMRAGVGVLLCVAGFVLARANHTFRQTTVIVDAGGCRLVTDILDEGNDDVQGSVVLVHGLAANKKIMAYLARAFALQNLRVFVPDLPGHGRTQGPFSFARAESCTESLVRQLSARGAIDPERTIIAGHSMGGAIAVLVAGHIPVAGVVAISPAPMNPARGIPAFMLPFDGAPKTPPHTLAVVGVLELRAIRESAQDLISGDASKTGKYLSLPWATHVGILFDSRAARAEQEWAAQVLHLEPGAALPSSRMLAGSLVGFAGLLVLGGPFLREMLGMGGRGDGPFLRQDELKGAATEYRASTNDLAEVGRSIPSASLRIKLRPYENPATATIAQSGDRVTGSAVKAAAEPPHSIISPAALRALIEVALFSVVAVMILRFWNPLRVIDVFEADYLASFLLLLGVFLLLLHHKWVAAALRVKPATVVLAAIAAIVLHLLIIAWFDVTLSEAWFTAARWLRFPALAVAVLPYHAAEELLLGPVTAKWDKARWALALGFRLLAWGALLGGLFVLNSGQVLLLLLGPSLALFCVLQTAGMLVVRKSTGSPLATAVFGAILLAGFCLVVFPIT
jgi:pimeloyl-ACP methyl ester carboxylesterase